MGGVFLPEHGVPGEEVELGPDDAHHLIRVLRLRPGSSLWVSDGKGREADAVLTRAEGSRAWVRPGPWRTAASEPAVRVTLAQAVPKGDRMDWLVQKATEVGVHGIIPLSTKRGMVKLETGKGPSPRLERWRRIAREAARQVERPWIPDVAAPASLAQVLASLKTRAEETPGVRSFMPWEALPPLSLRNVLLQDPPAREVFVFIGPEGGWDPEEVEAARDAGVEPVSLGARILRSETAGIVALALVVALWGDPA